MPSTVAIIDYGSGNLHSVAKALERASRESGVDARIVVTEDPKIVRDADRVVLPGVGAFADCKRGLDAVGGMRDVLQAVVIEQARPFLGICVGMQLMAERGLEFTTTKGLGWIKGDVRLIEPADKSFKIPHMGWNTLTVHRPHPVLSGIEMGDAGHHAYFVHSFHLASSDPSAVLAETDYGALITAMVARDNLVGTQFHPEKSQWLGLQLLANFLAWRP